MGLLTEEAQETKNNDIKRFRERHTKKTSRQNKMDDFFNNLLLSLIH